MIMLHHCFQKVLREFTCKIFVSFLLSFWRFGHCSIVSVLWCLKQGKCSILRLIEVDILMSLKLIWVDRLIMDSDCLRLFHILLTFSRLLPTDGSLMHRTLMIWFWTKIMTLTSIWIWSFLWIWNNMRLLWFIISRTNVNLLHVQMSLIWFLMNEFNPWWIHRRWNEGILSFIFIWYN